MLIRSAPTSHKPYDIDNIRPIKTLREADEAVAQATERIELTQKTRAKLEGRAKLGMRAAFAGVGVTALYPVWQLLGGKLGGLAGVAVGVTLATGGCLVSTDASSEKQKLWFDQQRDQNKLNLFETARLKVQAKVEAQAAQDKAWVEKMAGLKRDDLLDIELDEGYLVVGDQLVEVN